MSTVAIIVALDRELAPLVQGWHSLEIHHNGSRFRVYEQKNLLAVAGGIGRNAASAAAYAVIAQYRPQLLISAGVAGALAPELKVGTVVTPNRVVDSATGTEYCFQDGNGILVTATEIVDSASKKVLAERFRASAVDMEASAVAQVARDEQIGFRCVKVISEEADFAMPPLNQFVDEHGRFRNAKFAAWAAFHPNWWGGIRALARNTELAVQALCDYLRGVNTEEWMIGSGVSKSLPCRG